MIINPYGTIHMRTIQPINISRPLSPNADFTDICSSSSSLFFIDTIANITPINITDVISDIIMVNMLMN